MIKHLFVAGAVLNLFVVPTTFAIAGLPDDEAKAAATAMVNRFVESWNRTDAASYGENYWPEAELVTQRKISDGKTAIVQEHIDIWAGILKGSHIEGQVRRIQMLGSNYMVVDFDILISGVHQFPPGSPVNANGVMGNHLKHVMEKRNGVWKVLSAQNTRFMAPN